MSGSDIQLRMRSLVERYAMLNRVPVSGDTTHFVRNLAEELEDQPGVDVLSVPSGTECLTWVVPERWDVNEAYIETLDGERIADFRRHPMYLHAHSCSFSGMVSREELLAHVTVHPEQEDRLTYQNRWQYRLGAKDEWAFSLPASVVRELRDEVYRVYIDAEFGSGTLDILDWTLPGKLADTVFFAAHTCHPGQVNDGLACMAVLIELFRHLARLPDRKYTYRLIAGAEYYAAAAVLQYGKGADQLKYGLYLDMMGHENPIGFARSFHGDTYLDHAVRNVLNRQRAPYPEAGYRGLYGNDEMFYDGPGFEIPTVGLARHPFRHYHTDWDDVEHCDFGKLEQSLDYLKEIADVFERDDIPVRTYRGPLYLSKFNLYIDPKIDPEGYRRLLDIQILIDGERSCLEVARLCGADFRFVRRFVDELYRNGLARIREPKTLAEVAK